jgi:ATPase subunit of ABC transporter with duplicated ATPase domains
MYTRQQREIAHLQSFVDRFRAKATKAKQAQSRLKALARMTLIAPAHVDTAFTFRFEPPLAAPSPLLTLADAVLGYDGERPIIGRTTLSLLPGARIGLLGRNGAGKSTFIKALAGESPLLGGDRHEGRGLVIGYFAQHQLEQLRADETPCSTSCASCRRRASRSSTTFSAVSVSASRRSRPSDPSPAGSVRGSPWRSSSHAVPTCCCSTSRPITSTSRCAMR